MSSVLTPPVGIPAVATPPSGLPALSQPAAPPTTPPIPVRTVVEPCVCGHAREAHEHYRRGTDCGACGAPDCAEYRAGRGSLGAVVRRLWSR